MVRGNQTKLKSGHVYLVLALIILFYCACGAAFFVWYGSPIAFFDFQFHLDKINNEPNGLARALYIQAGTMPQAFDEGFKNYPPLVHQFLGIIGATDHLALYTIMLVLILFIPTTLLVKWWGPWAGLIYLASELPHLGILQAAVPQAFIVLIFIAYLRLRENKWKWPSLFAAFFLSLIMHKHGPLLFGLVICAELLEKVLKIDIKNFHSTNLPIFYLTIFVASLFLGMTSHFRFLWPAEIVLCVYLAPRMERLRPMTKNRALILMGALIFFFVSYYPFKSVFSFINPFA